ncbi:MAG TPA: PVC-type heme-binding CxxCH protein [Tepidisphaeraceae bacterium]|nr:PVC-type heme-binding CxxCH protein [Tepidisphaeraceae bacterium]
MISKATHPLRRRTLLAALAFIFFPAGAFAAGANPSASERANNPEIERRSFKVAPGFEVHLFASDPMIAKPIEMNFDPDGRLWVCTSTTYPQIKPGQMPSDKVIVLEDSTGAGKADKSTVFAGGLLLPTGIVPGDGGAYVANSTEILHLRDTTGSGKADERRVVLSGFGTEDTHHIIHAFRWGPDGRLYFNQSIYIHSHIETPWGTKSLLGSGTWRFEPSTVKLNVYCRGQVNPWGIAWDTWGQTFETDGAGGEGIVFAFPGSAFQSAVGYGKVLPGMNPGSPKYASLEIVTGRAMPEGWRGTFLTNDFRANRICHFKLTDSGSGFVSRQLPDFITTKDVDFRPVDIKMGPDGAIYIADWYNPIIQHGEVDFRDPRRDHVHGRIWRVTAKGMASLKREKLLHAPVTHLLEALRAPELYTQAQARAALRERGAKEVAPALAAWVKAIPARGESADHDRLEGLWVYQSLDIVQPELLNALLGAKDFRARAASVRVLARWAPQIPNTLELLKTAVADQNPRVRLEAVRALAEVPLPESIVIAEHALDQPMDGNLDWALTRTARDLEPVWMPAFKAGQLTDWQKPAHLSRALQDVKSPAAMGVLVQQLKTQQLAPDARAAVIDLIAAIDPKQSSQTLYDLATGKEITDAPARAQLLESLAKTARETHFAPSDSQARLAPLIGADQDESLRAAAIRLAGAWHVTALHPAISIDAAGGPTIPAGVQNAAINALASFGDAQSIAALKHLAHVPTAIAVREQAIAALASIDPKEAAPLAADLLPLAKTDADVSQLLGAFVKRTGGAEALSSALSSNPVSADTARLSLHYLQKLGGEENALTTLFRKAAGVSTGPTKLSAEQMKQMVAEVQEKGNAANGEKIFRQQGCYQCHAIGGAGGQLAPDLRAIGASGPVDYLVDSVLDPNKAIKDGYQGYTIQTTDGDVFSGIKVRQDANELILRDATHEVTIPLASIKQQKDIGSLMPTGLADTLTHGEFLDLIKFLSELGKPGPYGPDTAQVARRWQVPQFVPDADPAGDLPISINNDGSNWMAQYTLVSGELPASAFHTRPGKKIAWARTQLSVTSAGKIRVLLSDPRGLELWVDGKRTEPKTDMPLDLPVGVHALTVRVDFAARGKNGIRVELQDVPGSAGHAQPVLG